MSVWQLKISTGSNCANHVIIEQVTNTGDETDKFACRDGLPYTVRRRKCLNSSFVFLSYRV